MLFGLVSCLGWLVGGLVGRLVGWLDISFGVGLGGLGFGELGSRDWALVTISCV